MSSLDISEKMIQCLFHRHAQRMDAVKRLENLLFIALESLHRIQVGSPYVPIHEC